MSEKPCCARDDALLAAREHREWQNAIRAKAGLPPREDDHFDPAPQIEPCTACAPAGYVWRADRIPTVPALLFESPPMPPMPPLRRMAEWNKERAAKEAAKKLAN
jgi:hypothetical protein